MESHHYVALTLKTTPPTSPVSSANGSPLGSDAQHNNTRLTPSSKQDDQSLEFSSQGSRGSESNAYLDLSQSDVLAQESDDDEYDFLIPTQDRAQHKIDAANRLMEEEKFFEAAKRIEKAIIIYKTVEDKNLNYWKTLAEYRELHASAYQRAHKVTLDSHVKALDLLSETKDSKEQLSKQVETLQNEVRNIKTARDVALQLLRTQIQTLQNRPQPTFMEYIANGIVGVFDTIRHCNLHIQLAESIHSFWTNLTSSSAPNVDPGSPSEIQRLKHV